MHSHDAYKTELFIAWTTRAVLAISLVAVAAIMAGCSHNLDLSSKGSLVKDNPPATNTIAN